jgi:hypothetical protein
MASVIKLTDYTPSVLKFIKAQQYACDSFRRAASSSITRRLGAVRAALGA